MYHLRRIEERKRKERSQETEIERERQKKSGEKERECLRSIKLINSKGSTIFVGQTRH